MVAVTKEPGTEPARADAQHARSARRRRRILGENPLGLLLSAPYLIFIRVVFAFPLVFAVWMSFHDYIFTAPGVSVPRSPPEPLTHNSSTSSPVTGSVSVPLAEVLPPA